MTSAQEDDLDDEASNGRGSSALRERLALPLSLASIVVSLLASAFALLAPWEPFGSLVRASRLGIVPLVVPVILPSIGMIAVVFHARLLHGFTVLIFWLFVLAAGFSIGPLYIPAALLLLAAALTMPSRRRSAD
jgi:hypothetical protein